MQRIMVDLPDPDGPQMTMRSPPPTLRLMSRRTWKSPYHLFKSISSMAVAVLSLPGLSSCPEFPSAVMRVPSPPVAFGKTSLHGASIARHSVAEDQIKDCGDRVAGRACDRGRPFRIDARHLDRAQEIEDADDENQRRVLEQTDIGVDDVRDRYFHRLRQNNKAHHL